MITRVDLPAPCFAAAADGDTVWCGAGGRLLVFDSTGRLVKDAGAVPGLLSLGAWGGLVAATFEPGVVAWLDARSGGVIGRKPVGGDPRLVSGGGVWAVDAVSGRAWRLSEPGVLAHPVSVPELDRAAADGDRLWWTSRRDATLSDGARAIDLGAVSAERGGMVACAGSVWVSVPGKLVRVGAWASTRGADVPVPFDTPAALACAGGVLVGCSAPGRLFVLDPSADTDVRLIETTAGGEPGLLVATRATAWVFARTRPTAHLVPVRIV